MAGLQVLFSCFKRKLTQDIKVAQLAGYVAEHSAYHHGEASLCGTIVGMAQVHGLLFADPLFISIFDMGLYISL